MYSITLAVHNVVRWLVLLAALYAVIRAVRGLATKAAWGAGDTQAVKTLTGSASLQFLLGIVLYALSPLVRQGWSDFGAAMRDATLRQFVIEHPIGMILFVALSHIGAGRVQKAPTDAAKFKAATIFFVIGLVVLLAMIPWNRRLLPF